MDRRVGRTDPLGHTSTYAYDERASRFPSQPQRLHHQLRLQLARAADRRHQPGGQTWTMAYDDEGSDHLHHHALGLTTATRRTSWAPSRSIDPWGL